MKYSISFNRDGVWNDLLIDKIRDKARADGWTGIPGFKEWAKKEYKATLRTSIYAEWTSITFKDEQALIKFKEDFGIDKERMNKNLSKLANVWANRRSEDEKLGFTYTFSEKALEVFVGKIVEECVDACATHDMESFGIYPIRAEMVTKSCQDNIKQHFTK